VSVHGCKLENGGSSGESGRGGRFRVPVTEDCAESGQYHPGSLGCTDCRLDEEACVACGDTFDDCYDDDDCCPGFVCDESWGDGECAQP
jgi:hypothetical protein